MYMYMSHLVFCIDGAEIHPAHMAILLPGLLCAALRLALVELCSILRLSCALLVRTNVSPSAYLQSSSSGHRPAAWPGLVFKPTCNDLWFEGKG